MMLAAVSAEALDRIAAARSLLRSIDAREQATPGDDASRSAKGMLFVQNYAVYEYVVVESVRTLVANVNARSLTFASTRPELLGMALDAEFKSIIDGSPKKTWDGRSLLLGKARSADPVAIREGLFPKDGTHFRPGQLETIWNLFGVPGPIVPAERLRGHIEEIVNTRNRIAHGSDAPARVGGAFSVADLKKRIDDTEAVCAHIMLSVAAYVDNALAFTWAEEGRATALP